MSPSHRPRKRFGQHFLVAPEFIRQIVECIAPGVADTLVEIGPGQGAITQPLARRAGELHAIELDRDLCALLREKFAGRQNVIIHQADALEFDYASLGKDLRVVGNLPYNISTPLLFRLLDYAEQVRDLHFMLQKEVVDRICASPGNKSYGRLTIMLGSRLESQTLFDVPPEAFSPPPRVVSAVCRLRPLPAGTAELEDPALFSRLVAEAFSKRRKTLRNALKGLATEAQLETAGIDPGSRPEQLATGGWIRLANMLSATAQRARKTGHGKGQ